MKHKRIDIYIYITFLLACQSKMLFGQQLPVYTQYKLNAHVLNPAISGAHGYTTVNITTRDQWLGFKGSPNTYTLSSEWRLLKRSSGVGSGLLGMRKLQKSREGNIGAGGIVFRDVNGAVSRTGVKGAYSYHIGLYRSQLSFGMAVSLFQFKIDKDQLVFPNPNEPLLNDFRESAVTPDAAVGMYYLARNFYGGGVADQLFQSVLKIGGGETLKDFKLFRHYYLNAGYRLILNENYDIEPHVLMKITEPDAKGLAAKIQGLGYQSDISLQFNYRDDYWVALSYRVSRSRGGGDVVVMGGVRYNNIYIAYSFDYTLSRIMSYSYGSHELSLGMKLGATDRRFKWIDRY